MPATPKINYFESRQGYFTQFRKRQRLLAHGPIDYSRSGDGSAREFFFVFRELFSPHACRIFVAETVHCEFERRRSKGNEFMVYFTEVN